MVSFIVVVVIASSLARGAENSILFCEDFDSYPAGANLSGGGFGGWMGRWGGNIAVSPEESASLPHSARMDNDSGCWESHLYHPLPYSPVVYFSADIMGVATGRHGCHEYDVTVKFHNIEGGPWGSTPLGFALRSGPGVQNWGVGLVAVASAWSGGERSTVLDPDYQQLVGRWINVMGRLDRQQNFADFWVDGVHRATLEIDSGCPQYTEIAISCGEGLGYVDNITVFTEPPPTETHNLVAGQYIDVGTVEVWNDSENLHVDYMVTDGWQLAETHLHVGTALNEIPQTQPNKKGKGGGNPIPGHFDYSGTGATYVIPIDPAWAEATELLIAAHAVVQKGDQVETAWGDGEQFPGTNWATYFIYTPIVNKSPVIISTPVTTGTEGVAYSYDVQADDPDGDTLTYSLTTSPTGMTIDAATGLIGWTPSGMQAGSHAVMVEVSDGRGGTDTQSFSIIVAEVVNNSPTITSTPVTTGTEGVAYSYDVQADDPDGDTLTYSLTTSPTGMTIDAATGLISWTPTNSQIGVHSVVVQVVDGRGGADTQAFTITVEATGPTPDHIRPEVDVTVVPSAANVGDSVTITVNATDNVGVVSAELTVNGLPVPLDASGTATYNSGTAGVFTAVSTALDAAGNEGLDAEEFRFLSTGDTTPPVVAVTSPAAGAEISSPTDVVGTASDDNLTMYKLQYSAKDRNEFITFASGTSSVTDGVLGSLDATTLRNGLYDIKLTAEDASGNVSSITMTYQLEGEMKVGNFTITFNDLTVPVSGIPITVTRTYDSRVKTKGDFGVGWRLDVKGIELSESGLMGDGWQVTSTGGWLPWYIISATESHYVTVTFPDGRIDEFDGIVSPDRQQLVPLSNTTVYFDPKLGTLSSLIDPTWDNVDLWIQPELGIVQLLSWATFEPYDPYRYQLTDKDGTIYVISNQNGLESITDRNGNTITFTADGIIHSAGKSVLFAKDAQGRVTTITDPMGNVIQYNYDYYGDLISVTDQGAYTTQFTYNSTHGLTQIIDPRGIGVARNEYDDDGRLVATVDADGNRVEFTHDVDARQEVVTDRLGNITVYEYDDDGNVTSKTDAIGNRTEYTYDDRGNKLGETDAFGSETTYTYDAQDNLLTQTDPLGSTTTYTYNSQGQVLTTTDPLGNVTTNTYDAAGNLTSTTDALGNVTLYSYDAAGNMTSETDALGNVTTYTYDTVGNTLSQTDPLGNTTTYTYDDNGNRLTETRSRTTSSGPEIMTTTYIYDAMNRVVQTTDPLGNTTATEYNAIGKESARINPLGNRTRYEYDSRGNLSRTIYPDDTEESSTYDAEGRRITSTDRSGRITLYTYDTVGRLVQTIFPDGSFTQVGYDAVGRVLRNIDPRGNATEYEYDAAGRNTAVVDAIGNSTEYGYNDNGNRVSMTDVGGNTTLYHYDVRNRLIETTYADSSTSTITYDALGRKIAETDQAGNTTHFAYDALGRLTSVTDALGNITTYTYDEVGNRLTQTDGNGNTTSFEYDSLGRQISRTLPLGMTETMAYDATGNLVSKTDFNGNTTTYQYSPCCGRLTHKEFQDGTSVSFTYTATGMRETETDAVGGVTAYTYDARDRLLSRTDPDGSDISYTYDAAGNRTSVTTPAGVTAYSYDALNRLATVTDPDGGVTAYTYDAVGNRAGVTNPNGTVTQYTYDALNRLTNLINRTSSGAIISSYAYALGPAGNRTQVLEDTGRTVNYAYDNIYRLVAETISDPSSGAMTINYSYDPVGNRLSKTVATSTYIATTSYSYDENDRLLLEQENVAVVRLDTDDRQVQYAYMALPRPSASAGYMVDGFLLISLLGLLVPCAVKWGDDSTLGRRELRRRRWIRPIILLMVPAFFIGAENVWGASIESTLYNTMVAAGLGPVPGLTTTAYTYDSNGNTLTRTRGAAADTYDYDYENRLIAGDIQLGPDPGPVAYTYDADGIRTSKTTNDATTSYLADKNRPFAEVLVEDDGATTVSYVHGDDLISMKRPAGTSYYHYDGQMSTRKLTDTAEAVTDTYTYDAFGIELARTGTTINNYLYTGEQYDPNIGFYYLRARYYNQDVGRFITVDPFAGSIFDPMSLHKYLYAHSNPVMFIDPSGKFTLTETLIVSVCIEIISTSIQITYGSFYGTFLGPGEYVEKYLVSVGRGVLTGAAGFWARFFTNAFFPFWSGAASGLAAAFIGRVATELVDFVYYHKPITFKDAWSRTWQVTSLGIVFGGVLASIGELPVRGDPVGIIRSLPLPRYDFPGILEISYRHISLSATTSGAWALNLAEIIKNLVEEGMTH